MSTNRRYCSSILISILLTPLSNPFALSDLCGSSFMLLKFRGKLLKFPSEFGKRSGPTLDPSFRTMTLDEGSSYSNHNAKIKHRVCDQPRIL